MRGLVLKELGKRRTCNLAECTKINFIRIMQVLIQIPPASVRHIFVLPWASYMLLSLKCSLGICTHYLFFVRMCDRIPACVLKCVSSSLPGICSLREISRRAAYANRRPRHDSRNGKPPTPFPCCTAVWNWIMGLSLIC